jgi:hypothetical protein
VNRHDLLQRISHELDGRKLIWFGTRGDDVESLTELREFSAAFSIIGAYDRRHSVESLSLEDLTRRRVDLDAYEIDEEPDHEAFADFRRSALRALSVSSAVVTYRPSVFVSSLCFARRDRCRYLGMFKDHQAAFEHKPWVESSLRELGVPSIPWTYVADEDQLESMRFLHDGPVMLRRSRSSGGTGLVKVDYAAQLAANWPQQAEAYVSVAPFIDGGIPLNVGAVVWPRNGVTLHPASLQLIGIPSLTTRPFGYCGNDFGATHQLETATLDEVERHMVTIGNWLRDKGFVGAFGVDFLIKNGRPLFTEVNPRFQGSTHLSCEISVELDESCILLDHVAANLGLDAPRSMHLADYQQARPSAHLVLHSTASTERRIDGSLAVAALRAAPGFRRADVVTSADLLTDPGATVARVTMDGPITTSGFDLAAPWADAAVRAVHSATSDYSPSDPLSDLERGATTRAETQCQGT